MISVIIPVYNVERFLPKCINSVIRQTYKELDIILVNDGSTDSSGDICNDYAAKDKRIRVINTENRGLSAARNIGIDNALPQSEWIAFVDSDDYIEHNMFAKLLKKAPDSDIIECGLIKEYRTTQKVESLKKGTYSTREALVMLINGKIRNYAWDKLYRKELFREIRFPRGRNYEDVAIQHLLVSICKRFTIVDGCYYHYIQRSHSITKGYRMNDLADRWVSYYERYVYALNISYINQDKAACEKLLKSLRGCAEMIWEWFYHSPKTERNYSIPVIRDISLFYRKNIPFWGFPSMSFGEKLIGVLIHSSSKASLAFAYFIYQTYMRLFKKTEKNKLV